MERLADARGRPGAASKVAALLCALSDTLRPTPRAASRRRAGRVPAARPGRPAVDPARVGVPRDARVRKDGLITKDGDGIVLLDRARLEAV